MCGCFCQDLKELQAGERERSTALPRNPSPGSGLQPGPESALFGQQGRSTGSGRLAGKAERRGLRVSPQPHPQRKCFWARPSSGDRFPSPLPLPDLPSAIPLPELVGPGPQHPIQRGSWVCAPGCLGRCSQSLPLSCPPYRFCVICAAADGAGDRTGKVSASEGAGVDASRAGLTRERSTARVRLFFPNAVIVTLRDWGGRM